MGVSAAKQRDKLEEQFLDARIETKMKQIKHRNDPTLLKQIAAQQQVFQKLEGTVDLLELRDMETNIRKGVQKYESVVVDIDEDDVDEMEETTKELGERIGLLNEVQQDPAQFVPEKVEEEVKMPEIPVSLRTSSSSATKNDIAVSYAQ